MTAPEAATAAKVRSLAEGALQRSRFYGIEVACCSPGDRDVDACIQRFSSAETRILLLHGNTGCGKSSFLRAGLIPGLKSGSATSSWRR
jgi:hypothetical protein